MSGSMLILVRLNVPEDEREFVTGIRQTMEVLKTHLDGTGLVQNVSLVQGDSANAIVTMMETATNVSSAVERCKSTDPENPQVYEYMPYNEQTALTVLQWIESNTLGSFPYRYDVPPPRTGCSIDPDDGGLVIVWDGGSSKARPLSYVVRIDDDHFQAFRSDEFKRFFEIIE